MNPMDEKKPTTVLFVGGANAARSIMAEAILNREGKGRFQAFSAGIQPTGHVHPYALDLLARLNFDVRELRPKSCLSFIEGGEPALDFVFSVCDGAADTLGSAWPGNPVTGHWALPDPAVAGGNHAEVCLAFADVFRMLNNRITILASLPIQSLDCRLLNRELDLIAGRKDKLKAPAAA